MEPLARLTSIRLWRCISLIASSLLILGMCMSVQNQVNGSAAWQIDLGKIDPSAVLRKLDIKIGTVDQSGAVDTTDDFPLFALAARLDAAGDPGMVVSFLSGTWICNLKTNPNRSAETRWLEHIDWHTSCVDQH
jgi:hypothetical protein